MPTTYSGAGTGLFQVLYQWGVLDAILPFLLIFIIVFAVLQKIMLFKDDAGTKGDKKINGILALIIGLMVVFPHVLNLYPVGSDPVIVIGQILPGASALLIAVLLVIILLGLAGGNVPSGMIFLVAFIALLAMALIIIMAIFPGFVPGFQFLRNPAMQAALVIILVMGLVAYFIMSEPSEKGAKGWLKEWMGPP